MHLQQNMQPVHFVMSATMKSRQLVIWSFSLGSYFYCSHKGKKLAQSLSVYCAHKRYVWLYVCPHACNCYGNRFCSQKSNQLSNWIRHVKLPFSPAMHISWTPRIVSLLVWKQRGLTTIHSLYNCILIIASFVCCWSHTEHLSKSVSNHQSTVLLACCWWAWW